MSCWREWLGDDFHVELAPTHRNRGERERGHLRGS
jgi:hypothetical protein